MFSVKIILITVLASIGIMFFFVGSLISVATAFGNNQKAYGWGIILFLPISLIYCGLNWEKAWYPGRMVFGGVLLVVLGLIAFKI